MQRALAVGFVLLASCQDAHHVDLLLGPDRTTLSRGFQCREPDGDLMAGRAFNGGTLAFNVVVDFIELGDGVPGCFGEEILTWCETHQCRPMVVGDRYCKRVSLDGVVPNDPATFAGRVGEIYDDLREHGPVITDAPDGHVIVRVVATTQECSALGMQTGDPYPPFDQTMLVGCAHSCPVQLDDATGAVQVFLGVQNEYCEPAVQACAGGLGPASPQ